MPMSFVSTRTGWLLSAAARAHLALLLGTFPPDHEPADISSRVQAVVSMYGPAELPSLVTGRHLSSDPARQLLGQDPPDWPAGARAASPLEHVSRDDSPTLLAHGSDDLGAARAVAANGREPIAGRRA